MRSNVFLDAERGSNFLQCFDLLWVNFTAIDRQRIIRMGSFVPVEVHPSPLLDIVSPFLSPLVSCTVETVLCCPQPGKLGTQICK